MRWVVVLLALAGCDRLLKLDAVTAPHGDAPVTPLDIGDAPPGCAMTDPHDDFEGSIATCGTWGTLDDPPGWITRANGELVIAPTPGSGQFVDCYSMEVPLGAGGVFVHVPSVGSDSSYGVIELYTYSTPAQGTRNADTTISFGSADVAIYDQDTCMGGTCTPLASVRYVAFSMQWFALVPVDSATALAAEYSQDGMVWHEIGRRMLPPGETATYAEVTVGGGAGSASTNPTATRFDSLDVCPGTPGG